MIKKLLLAATLFLASASFGQIVFGTPVSHLKDPAGTTDTSGATYTASANSGLLCVIAFDDNGSTTVVNSIVVSGSPTYSTAWAKRATDGRVFVANQGGTEVWTAETSSGFTNQTITPTISSSERFAYACVPISGIASGGMTGGNSNSAAPTNSDPIQVTVTSSGHNNSKYIDAYGCFDNVGHTFTSAAAFTDDACINCANEANVWVHVALAHSTSPVSPAANTTVGYSNTKGGGANPCTHPEILASEILVGAGGGTPTNQFPRVQ